VWTFTLRDGLKFEDGTAITSKEIAYGVARSFSPALADGPTWLQQWLAGDANFNQKYRGPYDGGAPTPPGVETPDPKTIVFRFSRPQPDMPFAATLGNTTPVPPAKDTKTAYDNKPVASGPYRVETYQRGTRLVLARNPHWSAATDPVRHAYADRFVLTFGQNPVNATQRILAGNGADQAAISWEMVPPQTLPRITSNQAVESHATRGATAYVGYLKINMQRVTDLSVRRALNCAFDRDAYIKATGGQAVAEPATTLLAKVVSGHRQYDAYHCGASGDPAKARKMLGGRTVTLSYGFRNNERGQKVAATIQSSLRKAGFDLKLVPIESTDYYTTIRTKNNGLDIYMASWGADWPSGATVIPALADGRTIADRGNSNTSYFNDAAVNAEIDRISSITNLTKASLAWAALDEKIMRKYAPMVPVYYDRTYSLNGAKVGGLHMDDVLGGTSLIDAYVK
jgi:peptide/nickel transport system substrate-binding protein